MNEEDFKKIKDARRSVSDKERSIVDAMTKTMAPLASMVNTAYKADEEIATKILSSFISSAIQMSSDSVDIALARWEEVKKEVRKDFEHIDKVVNK